MTNHDLQGDHENASTTTALDGPPNHQSHDDGEAVDTANIDEFPYEECDTCGHQEPSPDIPAPAVLSSSGTFYWDDDAPAHANYGRLGERLSQSDDLYRIPRYGSGLLLASEHPSIPPKQILTAGELAPVIADRVPVCVIKSGKARGSQISTGHLNSMLRAEVFLQRFRPLDDVVTIAMYLPNFELTQPGYNDGGPGHRVFLVGTRPAVEMNLEAIPPFLDVMAFASNADRTNAVAAALTVMLRNHWPGAKPLIYVTSTKSHGGKDTIVDFACGGTPHTSLSYEKTDWALQKNFCIAVHTNPDLGVVVVENVRLDDGRIGTGGAHIRSAFLERLLTDPNPTLFSTGSGDPRPRKNDLVLAMSTNFGRVSDDLMNRALPIRLEPVGDVARRESPIGNSSLLMPDTEAVLETRIARTTD